MKRLPRWTIAFLRALERTGEVRGAAEDAGVDYSTAYARRRAHKAFAVAWAEALERHRAAKARAEGEAVEAIASRPLSPLSCAESPSPAEGGGDELVASGSQMKRVGPGRWGQAKEKVFFEELAATANVGRAAKAAGVSPNAVQARRRKHPVFGAKWAAVLAAGRASIEMHLVGTANQSFDPDDIETGAVAPKVTVAEAIKIVQMQGNKAERSAVHESEPPPEEIDEIRKRLLGKIQRLRQRERPGMLAAGWSHDESYGCMVPPGWVMGPDYVPQKPEPPAEDHDR